MQCAPQPSPDERPGPYDQCGGRNYNGFLCEPSGSQCCSSGLQCIWINEYFSQCLPEGSLADLDEPCGPATTDNKSCLLRSRASGPVLMKCSSDTDPDAVCVLCGFRGLACCPAGVVSPDRPPCQAAPRFTPEIPCNTEDDICEGDIIRPDDE